MRELTDTSRLRSFMREMGRTGAAGRVDLTGGSTAVLMGWRESTVDIDLKLEPDPDVLLRAIQDLKERLKVNVELACPSDFIPELPGWRDRSPFIEMEGRLAFHHYDPYSQALSKIERDHERDRLDVAAMLACGLVKPSLLRSMFAAIEPQLLRYPAINAAGFRARLDEALRTQGE